MLTMNFYKQLSKHLHPSVLLLILLIIMVLITACGGNDQATPEIKVGVSAATPTLIPSTTPPINTAPRVTTVPADWTSSSKFKSFIDTVNLFKFAKLEATTSINIKMISSTQSRNITDSNKINWAMSSLNQPLLAISANNHNAEANSEISEINFKIGVGQTVNLQYASKSATLQLQQGQPSDWITVYAPVSFLQAIGLNSTRSESPTLLTLNDYGTTTNLHGSLFNEVAQQKFLAAYKQSQASRWEVLVFTVEGQPISFQFYYNGNGSQVNLNLDNTRDSFASSVNQKVTKYICQNIVEEGKGLKVSNCSDGNQTINLSVP